MPNAQGHARGTARFRRATEVSQILEKFAKEVSIRLSVATDDKPAWAIQCPKCLLAAAPVYRLIRLRYILDHMRCTNPNCSSFEP
jgi:hypothetical protein